jgi:hypothetical protein
MEIPDTNIRLFRTNSNKISIIGELNAGDTGYGTVLVRKQAV